MLRFAAAVLAVAAIAPTPAEKGLARLSEALASPAIVNNDVLWTRCGAWDKIAPIPTTVVAAETPIAAGPSQSRCNDPHLSVSTLERGRHERGEDRDRRANFLTRALSVEHPAVLPTAHSFSHEPTCSSFHTLACCTYGARRMQRFSPDCRRPWRHERGRGSRLTGQLSYTRALGRASCCAAYSSGAAVCRGASLSVHPAGGRVGSGASCSWCRWVTGFVASLCASLQEGGQDCITGTKQRSSVCSQRCSKMGLLMGFRLRLARLTTTAVSA